MELIKKSSSNSYSNSSQSMRIYEYHEGLKNFFNSKRNQGKCAEIIHYLTVVEKLQFLKLCRNIFYSTKKEIDFKHCNEVMKKINKNDLDELNFQSLYDELANYYEIHSKSEQTKETYAQNMLIFCAAMINKFYIEPKRFFKDDMEREKFAKCFRKYDEDCKLEWKFFNKKLDKFGLKVVSNVLIFNSSLKSIMIRGCSIDDEDVKFLLSYVNRNNTLETLDLMYNTITNVGCKYIQDFLVQNQHLKGLAIGMNKEISQEGLEYISEGLIVNYTLQHISLQGMRMDDSHAEIINKILTHNKGLKRIDIQNNKFTKISIELWKPALEKNTHLTGFNLFGNQITDEGGFILADILLNHPSLSRIELNCTGLSRCGDKLLNSFRENKNIKCIQVLENFKDNGTIIEEFSKLNSSRNQTS